MPRIKREEVQAMNYFELQLLYDARMLEMKQEEKERQLASHRVRARRQRTSWIGLLTAFLALGIVIWHLL